MKLLVIDNYDSFTYNLVHFLGELGVDSKVWRNDKISLDEIAEMAPEGIVLSPGPGTPQQAGICLALIDRYFPPPTPDSRLALVAELARRIPQAGGIET